MKRFVIKILLCFLLPIASMLIVQEVALRSIPNDYAYKNHWLTDNARQLKILTLGSSHGYFGIQPTEFSKLAFNAGHVSQSLLFDKFILEKFAPKMDSLEYVILPVSYFAIRSKGLEHGDENWRVKNYTIYYDCPYFKYQPQYALECYKFAPKATIKALLGRANYQSCDSLGRGTEYVLATRSEDWMDAGPSAKKRHTNLNYKQSDIDKNIAYINEIISICETKGVKVILVTTPTYHTYYDILDKEQYHQMVECCTSIANAHSNTIYLNWIKHPDFNEHDFWDADHLNEYGAIKLTQLLNNELIRL